MAECGCNHVHLTKEELEDIKNSPKSVIKVQNIHNAQEKAKNCALCNRIFLQVFGD